MPREFKLQPPVIRWPTDLPPLNKSGLVEFGRRYKVPSSGSHVPPKNDRFLSLSEGAPRAGVLSGIDARRVNRGARARNLARPRA